MENRKIYAIGESLLDIIFENSQPKAAKPGGSTLNTSVTLGRLGLPVSFISEWGNDRVGELIAHFLEQNNVSTKHVYRYSGAKTTLAIAFLDESKNASYEFYKNYPAMRLQTELPVINENDIVLYSSFFAVNPEVRPVFIEFIKKAKEANAILIYDPNFRKSHSDSLDKLRPMIEENISLADIVRGSDEDFENIFGATNYAEAYQHLLQNNCNNLIYTASSKGIHAVSGLVGKKYEVKEIEPVSTIGAGDNFNAGIIYALYKNEISKNSLTILKENQFDEIIKAGTDFAQQVCMGLDNYVSEEFAGVYAAL